MERIQKLLAEYDLNIFFRDLGHDENGINQWAEVYTIQPSIYYETDTRNDRVYMDAFDTTPEETSALYAFLSDPDAEDSWLSVDTFYILGGDNIPPRIRSLLWALPDIEEVLASKLS